MGLPRRKVMAPTGREDRSASKGPASTKKPAESAKKAGTAQQSQSGGQGRQQGASSEAESRKPDDKAKKSR